MIDAQVESTGTINKEAGPTTKFGTALVSFADRMDALAGKETNLTHKQLWLALGTEAVVGAVAIALVGSGEEINTEVIRSSLIERMKYSGTVNGQEWVIARPGEQRFSWGWGFLDMKIGDFARTLIEGGFKDSTGKSIFLLNDESTANIVQQLDQLTNLEDKRDQLRNLFLLGGIGSVVGAALQAKANEKVKVSAPVGKVPAVMPAIANVMRGIGKLF